ncbi:cytochrome P450, partial [Marasmius fiardii PR-910]
GFVTFYALYRIVLYPIYLSPLRNVPGPPLGPNLLIGEFGEIINGEAGIPQREWVKKHGQAIRVVGPLGIQRMIFCRPEALHRILVSNWLTNPRPSFMREILGSVAGYGLLTVTGNKHKQMRKAMNPAFSIASLSAQTDMYYDVIDSLIDILNDTISDAEKRTAKAGSVEEMYIWMSKVTLDIICTSAFGYNADSLHNPHNELAEAYEELLALQTGRNLSRFIFFMSIPGFPMFINSEWAWKRRKTIGKIPGFRTLEVLTDSMHRIKTVSAAILKEKMDEVEGLSKDDTLAKKDIMSLLVRARKAEMERILGVKNPAEDSSSSYTMSDKEMIEQVLTFLAAGHETTASGLAWTLWLLANDKESQRKLREEVRPLFEHSENGTRKARLSYRELKDLNWLDCVVNESLRLYPPVPMSFRQAASSDVIDGIFVPKGTIFYIPIRVVNTMKNIWGEDAEEFNPSRWLKLPDTYNPTFSVLSFLAGPHACIGRTMAIVEMKAVLAGLIANFEFEPSYEGQKTDPTAAVTMKPRDNMPLRVTRAY